MKNLDDFRKFSLIALIFFPSLGITKISDPGAAGTALYVSINKYLSITKKYDIQRKPPQGSPCPFKNQKFSELATKMAHVGSLFDPKGQCKTKYSSKINELEKSYTEFNQINGSLQSAGAIPRDDGRQVEPPAPPMNTLNPNEQVAQTKVKRERELSRKKVQLTSSYLGTLIDLAQDPSCQKDLKSADWLDIIGDVVLNSSNFGMIRSGPAGIITSVGGNALGSTLKIISFLLKSKYNFSDGKEQRAFLRMTCDFNELSGEIDESGILTVKNQRHDREIESYSQDIKAIDKELFRLAEVIQYFQEKQKGQLEELRDKAMGKEMADFLRAIEQDYDIFFRLLPQGTDRRTISEPLETLYENHKIILEKFNLAKKNNLFGLSNKYDLKEQDDSLEQLAKEVTKFPNAEAFADNFFKNKNEIGPKGEVYLPKLEWPYQKLKKMELEKMYQKQGSNALSILLNPTKFRSELYLERFQVLKEQFRNEIEFRKRLGKGGVWPSTGEGSQDKAAIVKGLEDGRSLINGTAGNEFLDYIIKTSHLYLEDFFAKYPEFKKAVPDSAAKCSLGMDLDHNYVIAEANTQLGVDFIEGNKYLFLEPRSLWRFLPGSNTKAQADMHNQLKSYEEAKKKLATKQDELEMEAKSDMVSPRDPKSSKTIGYCMEGVHQATFKKKRVQDQTRNCPSRPNTGKRTRTAP